MTTEERLHSREVKKCEFPNVIDENAYLSVNRIHPIKQHIVKDIVDVAKKDPAVKRIIIFGSSIRYNCDTTSDLDICIDWNDDCYDTDGVLKPFTRNMRKRISLLTKGNADVVNYDYLKGTLVEEAVRTGVVVYDREEEISHMKTILHDFEIKEEARQEGEMREVIRITLGMLQRGMSVEVVADMLGRATEDIARIRQLAEQYPAEGVEELAERFLVAMV